MSNSNAPAEVRFNRVVLGGWWGAVSVLGVLRWLHGDKLQSSVLMISASLTAALGLALAIDRERAGDDDTEFHLNKGATLFSVIAITTVVACAVLNGAIWWGALEVAALLWILPAVILPLAKASLAKRSAQPAT
jgi:hypothetical protein